MSPNKAPSEGQKVTLGKNAPVTREGPGLVDAGSLAAESETFRSANEAAPTLSHENITPSRPHEGRNAPNSHPNTGVATRNVETAPTYVSSQYIRDPAGPHGKNLKEDDSIGTEDRAKNVSFTEFGTKNDPGRLAEQKFTAMDSTPAASVPGARQKGIDGKTVYDALGSDSPA